MIKTNESLKTVRESYTLINESAVLLGILKNVNLSDINETRLSL